MNKKIALLSTKRAEECVLRSGLFVPGCSWLGEALDSFAPTFRMQFVLDIYAPGSRSCVLERLREIRTFVPDTAV